MLGASIMVLSLLIAMTKNLRIVLFSHRRRHSNESESNGTRAASARTWIIVGLFFKLIEKYGKHVFFPEGTQYCPGYFQNGCCYNVLATGLFFSTRNDVGSTSMVSCIFDFFPLSCAVEDWIG